MSATTFILDLVIKEAEMGEQMAHLKTPLWFVLTADGLSQPAQSTQAIPCQRPRWDWPVRLILSIQDITRAYLYVTMATYKIGADGVMAIARSKIGLRSLPIGKPKQFKFPLMQSSNAANIVAQVTFIATLSSITPAHPMHGSAPVPYHYAPEPFYGTR